MSMDLMQRSRSLGSYSNEFPPLLEMSPPTSPFMDNFDDGMFGEHGSRTRANTFETILTELPNWECQQLLKTRSLNVPNKQPMEFNPNHFKTGKTEGPQKMQTGEDNYTNQENKTLKSEAGRGVSKRTPVEKPKKELICTICSPAVFFDCPRKLYLHKYTVHPTKQHIAHCGKQFKQKCHRKRHEFKCKLCKLKKAEQEQKHEHIPKPKEMKREDKTLCYPLVNRTRMNRTLRHFARRTANEIGYSGVKLQCVDANGLQSLQVVKTSDLARVLGWRFPVLTRLSEKQSFVELLDGPPMSRNNKDYFVAPGVY